MTDSDALKHVFHLKFLLEARFSGKHKLDRDREVETNSPEVNREQVEAIERDEKLTEEGVELEIPQELINYREEYTSV